MSVVNVVVLTCERGPTLLLELALATVAWLVNRC
jgi:hypothetical protein